MQKSHHRSILIECNADECLMKNKELFPPLFWVYAKVYPLNKSFEIMVIVYFFQVKQWILSSTLFTFANFISCHLIKDAKFNAIQRQFPWSLTTSFQWNAVEKDRREELQRVESLTRVAIQRREMECLCWTSQSIKFLLQCSAVMQAQELPFWW